MEKHPSLGDNITHSTASPTASGGLPNIRTNTSPNQDFSFPASAARDGTADTSYGTTGEKLEQTPASRHLAETCPDSPLVRSNFGDECIMCKDHSGAALEREREMLLQRSQQLEAEQSAHANAAAEAARMRDQAARRAREIGVRLQTHMPTRRQQLLQQQEVRLGCVTNEVFLLGTCYDCTGIGMALKAIHIPVQAIGMAHCAYDM